jgi:hypothetical protein
LDVFLSRSYGFEDSQILRLYGTASITSTVSLIKVTSIKNYSNFTPKDLIGPVKFHVVNPNLNLAEIFTAENGWLDCGENDIFRIE